MTDRVFCRGRAVAGRLGYASLLAAGLVARGASAELPPAPESPYRAHVRSDESERAPLAAGLDSSFDEPGSLLRFHVGPALLLEPASPGLLTALDVGKRAVGARFSAAWLRPETERGLAAYTGELWVDLGRGSAFHPLCGAGASLLRGGALGTNRAAGAGVLRAALEYQLPLPDADARLALNAVTLVPAIESERSRPWLLAGLTIGAGF